MKTGAVVLAAGLSSRMKSFKPMLPLAGSTVIKTAISTSGGGSYNDSGGYRE